MSHQFMKEKNLFKCDIFDYISPKKGQIKKQRASSVQEGNNLFQIRILNSYTQPNGKFLDLRDQNL